MDKYLLHLQETWPYIPLKISETFVSSKKKKMFGQILGQKKKFLYSQKSKLVGISKYIYL